jgi:hypothetical protein
MEFSILKNTPLYEAFSDLGKRIYLPKGVFHWSGRAKKEAEIIGTIGAAYAYENTFIDNGSQIWNPCYLKDLNKYIKKNIDINEVVPYPPIGGIHKLRQEWKKWILKKAPFSQNVNSNEYKTLNNYISLPLITSGVTNGIFTTFSLLLDERE